MDSVQQQPESSAGRDITSQMTEETAGSQCGHEA